MKKIIGNRHVLMGNTTTINILVDGKPDYGLLAKLHRARDDFFKAFKEMGFKIDTVIIERVKDEESHKNDFFIKQFY